MRGNYAGSGLLQIVKIGSVEKSEYLLTNDTMCDIVLCNGRYEEVSHGYTA